MPFYLQHCYLVSSSWMKNWGKRWKDRTLKKKRRKKFKVILWMQNILSNLLLFNNTKCFSSSSSFHHFPSPVSDIIDVDLYCSLVWHIIHLYQHIFHQLFPSLTWREKSESGMMKKREKRRKGKNRIICEPCLFIILFIAITYSPLIP